MNGMDHKVCVIAGATQGLGVSARKATANRSKASGRRWAAETQKE
jgi:hypothetical protein